MMMRGSRTMPETPSTASTANHTSMTGPNSPPTTAVPRCCTRNSAISSASEKGMTYGSKIGVATFSPSTALNTEIAGVMTPSP